MSLMTSVGVFQDASIAGAVRMLFNSAVAEQSANLVYPQLGYVDVDAPQQDYQINALTGPGLADLTQEGQKYQQTEKLREFPVTVSVRKYTATLAHTEEVALWLSRASNGGLAVNEITNAVSQAVQALNGRVDLQASQTFHLGYSTTNSPVNSAGDVGNSEALFASHTLRKSGADAVRNTFAAGDTHRALASESLADGIDIMNRFRAHNDIELLPVKNLVLAVSKNNAAQADRLLNSDYGPLTAVLGQNIASKTSLGRRGMNISYVVDPWIPSAQSTYWTLIDKDRASNRLKMSWGWKPKMVTQADPETGSEKLLGSVYFRPVSHGWQYAFGSQGNNNAI